MSAPRLKTKLWVQAQIRLCDLQAIPAAILRRGDDDAGSVALKFNRLAEGCEVLTQFREPDGALAWMRGTGPKPVPETEADAYIARQRQRDPDLWVLEIEDPARRFILTDPVR